MKFSKVESEKSQRNDVKRNVRITAIQSINLGKVIDIKRFRRNIRLLSAGDHYVRGKNRCGRSKRRNISRVYHLVRFRTPAINEDF